MVLVGTFWKQWVMSIVTFLKHVMRWYWHTPISKTGPAVYGIFPRHLHRAGRRTRRYSSVNLVSKRHATSLYNATTVASKIGCLQFLAQSPGLPLGTRRHGLRIHRMHVDILGSLALAWMHQTMGGTEVKTGSNGQTELSILTVLLGYYICWKYIHNQKLLTIVVCVCGFIVWIEICRIMLKDRHK